LLTLSSQKYTNLRQRDELLRRVFCTPLRFALRVLRADPPKQVYKQLLSINNRIMVRILSRNDFLCFLGIKIVTIRFSVGFGTYLAPQDANFKAKSRPKPRAAPVISMTLPK
jgi:hypothetical protein